MVRKFLVSYLMLFLCTKVWAEEEKKHIMASGAHNEELFMPNAELRSLQQQAKISKMSSKKTKKNSYKKMDILPDIPRLVDAYDSDIMTMSGETRYEAYTKQTVQYLQEFYSEELTRLGWNVDPFSTLKEIILSAQKPFKKLLLIIEPLKGGWFSADICKIVIIIKEQQ